MLDAFREETIVRKVGGRFKLSALIQKRMVALNRGARPLVDIVANNPMMIVVEEILNDTSGGAYFHLDHLDRPIIANAPIISGPSSNRPLHLCQSSSSP